MTPVPRRKRNKGWIIAALGAIGVFLGGVAIEALSDDLKRILEPYRIYVWSVFGLAFVAAVLMAVREWRAKDDATEQKALSERNISTGEVKGSILITGDDNVVADRTQGDVVRGDKATNIDADGDVVQRDKIVHIHEPAIPVLSPLHQLPAAPRDFTGRTEEIEDLLREMEKGVTISGLHGLGGVGKTALALKLCEIIKDRYPDAQLYLDLKGVSDKPLTAAQAMAHVIRAYHPTEKLPEDEAQLSAIYNSVLDGKRALLVMDNARDRAQVEPLLPPSGCALIVTSRQHFTLPGLYEKDLDTLPLEDACKLLLRIAEQIGDHADEIAKLCGRLPLALRVAASVIAERKNLSPAEYARRLSDAKQRLSHLKEVDVVLNESCELLGEERGKLWRMLAAFPDTFDESAAAAVWEMEAEAANDALGDLLTYSMIEYDEETSRYRLHDLARIFADGRLSNDERDTAKRKHAEYYCRLLAQADELYKQGGEAIRRGLALFDLERGNIEAGWSWAESLTATDEQAAQLCIEYPDAGAYVLDLRQHPHEQIRWRESQLAAARRLEQRNYEGNALGNLGNAYADLGETRKAIEFHEQDLAIRREIGDRRGEGNALGNLGIAHKDLGETRKAIEYHEQALAVLRELGDRRAEGSVLGNLGLAYADLGETRKAIEFYDQQLTITREIGDRRGEGNALGNLGVAYAALGETRKAIEFYEQALVIDREIGDRRGEGTDLWNMSLALDKLGERAKAIECAESALRIREEIEDPRTDKVCRQLAEWRGESQQ